MTTQEAKILLLKHRAVCHECIAGFCTPATILTLIAQEEPS